MNTRNNYVMVGIPTTGQIDIRTMTSLFNAASFTNSDMTLNVREACYVDNSRQLIAQAAIKEGATHLMFIDSDMEFPADGIQKLMERDVDIVGGIYPRRQYPYRPTIQKVDGKKLVVPGSYPKDRMFEVDSVATGFMMIKTSVFAKMEAPYFRVQKFYGQDIRDDVFFCISARKKGFKVWCDPTIKLGHVGKYTFTMEDHEGVKPDLVNEDVEVIWNGEV